MITFLALAHMFAATQQDVSLGLAHMLDATQQDFSCSRTHVRCYANDGVGWGGVKCGSFANQPSILICRLLGGLNDHEFHMSDFQEVAHSQINTHAHSFKQLEMQSLQGVSCGKSSSEDILHSFTKQFLFTFHGVPCGCRGCFACFDLCDLVAPGQCTASSFDF